MNRFDVRAPKTAALISCMGRPAIKTAATLGLGVVLGLGVISTTAGAATRPARPSIEAPMVLTKDVPASGGTDSVLAMVYRATACRVIVLGHPAGVTAAPRWSPGCQSGFLANRIPVSPSPKPRLIRVEIMARGPGGVARRVMVIRQLAVTEPSPELTTITTTTTTITTTSRNWSGAVVQENSTVPSAGGSWTVPTLDCATSPVGAGVSIWIGTGGWTTGAGALLQTGVQSRCVDGVQRDSAWWEDWPSSPEMLDYSDMTVSPGDEMTASITKTSGGWETALTNETTGVAGFAIPGGAYGVSPAGASSFSVQGYTSATYSGGTTAEWVVEDYSLGSTQVPLAQFSPVTFTNTSMQLSESDAVTMVSSTGATMAAPGPVSGTSFTVSEP